MTTMPLAPIVERNKPSTAPLFRRLLAAASDDATDAARDFCLDVIAATGEQVSVGLVSLAIQKAGGQAQSFLGSQVRIITDSAFTRARRLIASGTPSAIRCTVGSRRPRSWRVGSMERWRSSGSRASGCASGNLKPLRADGAGVAWRWAHDAAARAHRDPDRGPRR